MPPQTPLTLRSTNGGIAIDNVNSHLDLKTTNGGLKLSRVGGDVEGRTTNGGIDATLDGAGWQGNSLDLQTTNGGVRLTLPENYNAHLEPTTTNGRVSVDFPVTMQGTLGRSLSTDLGSGGATIHVQTSNGGVKITRRSWELQPTIRFSTSGFKTSVRYGSCRRTPHDVLAKRGQTPAVRGLTPLAPRSRGAPSGATRGSGVLKPLL